VVDQGVCVQVVPAAEVTRDMIGAEEYDSRAAMVVRFFEDNLLYERSLSVTRCNCAHEHFLWQCDCRTAVYAVVGAQHSAFCFVLEKPGVSAARRSGSGHILTLT
jgi:hypothetical protein